MIYDFLECFSIPSGTNVQLNLLNDYLEFGIINSKNVLDILKDVFKTDDVTISKDVLKINFSKYLFVEREVQNSDDVLINIKRQKSFVLIPSYQVHNNDDIYFNRKKIYNQTRFW